MAMTLPIAATCQPLHLTARWVGTAQDCETDGFVYANDTYGCVGEQPGEAAPAS
jgi:hypothetical protein